MDWEIIKKQRQQMSLCGAKTSGSTENKANSIDWEDIKRQRAQKKPGEESLDIRLNRSLYYYNRDYKESADYINGIADGRFWDEGANTALSRRTKEHITEISDYLNELERSGVKKDSDLYKSLLKYQSAFDGLDDSFSKVQEVFSQFESQVEYDYSQMSAEEIQAEIDANSADYEIVFALNQSNVAYDKETALANGTELARWEDINEKRQYISDKYGVDFSNIYDVGNELNGLMNKLKDNVAYTTKDGEDITLQKLYDSKIAEKEYSKQQKENERLLSLDTDVLQKEIDALEAELKRLEDQDNKAYEKFNHADPTTAEYTDLQNQIFALAAQMHGIKGQISEKSAELTNARRLQHWAELGAATKNADFIGNSGYVSSIEKGFLGIPVQNSIHEYINRNNSEQGRKMEETNAVPSTATVTNLEHMNADEIALYNYWYNTAGVEKAYEYLESIQDTLACREADIRFEEYEGNTLKELSLIAEAGLDQFGSGVKSLVRGLVTDDNYIAPSSTQILSGMVRQDLKDDGAVVLGLYDLGTTTFNMLPSILTSVAVGAVSKTAGAAVGATLMGSSAAGNAYSEMINLGYSKEQSLGYAALVGGSEAGLQYLLGGIGKLGGKLSGNAVKTIVGGIDNAFAHAAIQFGGNLLAEGFEEGLQEILTPFFKNLVAYTDEDVNWNDVAYSALLGALSAGLLEGGSSISGAVSLHNEGKLLADAGIGHKKLSEMGKTFSADSVAYKLANKVDENTGAYTIARLFNEIGAELTESNKADIAHYLKDRGVASSHARIIAEGFANAVLGVEMNEKQIAALEKNPIAAQAVVDILIDPNSTVNKRSASYKDALAALSETKKAKAKNTAAIQGAETANVNAALAEASQKYGKQAKAMEHTYIAGQDVEKFDQSYQLAYDMGKNGVSFDYVTKSAGVSYLTDNQKQLAYEAGQAAASANLQANTATEAEADGDVSVEGKTIRKDTGDIIDVVDFATVDGDKAIMNVSDGTTVDAKNVAWESAGMAQVVETIASLGASVEAANAMLADYRNMVAKADPNISQRKMAQMANDFAQGIENTFQKGKMGLPAEDLNADRFASKLTVEQRQRIYEEGAKAAEADYKGKQANVDTVYEQAKKTLRQNKKVAKKDYAVTTKGIDIENMDDTQSASFQMAERIAPAVKADIVVYNGGKEWGYYNSATDEIYLNANAKWNQTSMMAFTLAHELVHRAKAGSPIKFKAFADFLIQEYGKQGADIKAMIGEQMAAAKEAGIKLTPEQAYEEVICDACQKMLMDTDAGMKLAEFGAQSEQNRNFLAELKKWLTELLEKLRNLFRNVEPDSLAAKEFQKFDTNVKQILANMFVDMSVDAGEKLSTIKEAGMLEKITTNEGGVKYCFGITQADIDTYIDAAYENNNSEDVVKYAEASDRLIDAVSSEIDISGYSHALRDNDIRHIRNSHGENTNEKYPVTKSDLARIPYIVENYDKVFVKTNSRGKPGIVYVKVGENNVVYYVEAVTTEYHNEKLLVNKQMVKTGIDEIPNLYGLIAAINKKESSSQYLADLQEIRKAYAQGVKENYSVNSIRNASEIVKENLATNSDSNALNAEQSESTPDNIGKLDGNNPDIRYKLPAKDAKNFRNGQNAKGEFVANVLIDLADSNSEWWTGRYNRGILGMSKTDDTEFRQFYQEIYKRTKDMDVYERSDQPTVSDTFTVQDGNGKEYIYVVEVDGYLHGTVLSKTDKKKYEAAIRKETTGGKYGKSAANIKGRTRSTRLDLGRVDSSDGGNLASNGNSGYGGLGGRTSESDKARNANGKGSSDQALPIGNEINDLGSKTKLPVAEDTSPRTLLANALESVAQNDIEKQKIAEYKVKVETIEAEEQKLHKLNAEIKELSFAKGKRDTARIKALRDEATKIANRIGIYDKQLLRLEASKALQNVLNREKKKAYDKAKQRGKEALAAYKASAEEKQAQLTESYRESRRKAVERHKESEAVKKNRAVVEKNAKSLIDMLAHPTKDVHVPVALQEPLREFLDSIDFSSKTQLAGEGMTIRDVAYTRALHDMRLAIAKQQSALTGAEDGEFTLDLPDGFLEEIDKHIQTVNEATKGMDLTTNRVYEMSGAELADLAHLLRTINKLIRDIDKLHMAGGKARVSELSRSTVDEMSRRKAVKGQSGGKAMWANYTPYYAFRRMGTAAQQIFKGLTQGQGKLARTADAVIRFAKQTYTTKEVQSWESRKNAKTITLDSGKTIQLTPAQIMSFWCLSQREQAVGHINGGGIFIDSIGKGTSKIVQKGHYLLTTEDVKRINSLLTDRQKAVAIALQRYMQDVGGKLINEISMARWDYMVATEENYYPIKTDDATRDAKSPDGEKAKLWALLNKSFTKSAQPNANTALIVSSIFDVFADHMSEAAEYNAFALPLVDAMKWFNFRERIVPGSASDGGKQHMSREFREGNGTQITKGMSDAERYAVLKDKKISLNAKVNTEALRDAESKIGQSTDVADMISLTERKKLFRRLGEEFGVFKGYENADVNLIFEFSKNNMRESTNKQRKNYADFAKMFSCFDDVIDNAIGIEIHNRNADGYKVDPTLKNTYVLVSAFEDGDNIVPVKLEIKEFSDKKNALYVAIVLESIKKDEVIKQGNTENGVTQSSRSSTISLADLFEKINPADESFLKYVPRQFLESKSYVSDGLKTSREATATPITTAATDTHIEDISVQRSIRDTLGTAAVKYFVDLMTDINSSQKSGRHENLAGKILGRTKAAAVGWNLRVAIQQPTAIFRASLILDAPSLLKGTFRIGTRKLAAEMKKYSGIALWKSMGYYDLNVSRNVREKIKGDSLLDKANDASMLLPGKMDEITWARIWAASKAKVSKEQKLTGEELLQATAELFEDVVYQTQVADSLLTRSSLMRTKTQFMKEATAFMAEPTVSLNILMSAFQDYQEGHTKWDKARRGLKIGFFGYAVASVFNALAASLMDAWRDDDEYEEFYEKYLQALFGEESFLDGNLFSELNPLEKVVFVRDAVSMLKGYSVTPGYAELVQSVINLCNNFQKFAEGRGTITEYGLIYQSLQVVGNVSGFGASGIAREAVSIWNNTFGVLYPDMIIHRYESDEKTKIRNAFDGGTLTAEEAMQELLRKGVAEDEDDAYWIVQAWEVGGDFSAYDEILGVVRNGGDFNSALDKLTAHGYEESKIFSHIKSEVGNWYKNGEITKQQAIDMLTKGTDLDSQEITKTVNKWSCKVVTGIDYNDIKAEFFAGKITVSRAIEMEARYGGYTREDAREKVTVWAFVKDNPECEGISYAAVEDYNTYCKARGVASEKFYDVWKYKSGRKKEQVLDYIDRLDLTDRQKDSLYYAFGWAESKIDEAPWH